MLKVVFVIGSAVDRLCGRFREGVGARKRRLLGSLGKVAREEKVRGRGSCFDSKAFRRDSSFEGSRNGAENRVMCG